MKLVNCEVGTKVVIKANQVQGANLRFFSYNVGQVCTITKVPDGDGDVRVQVDSTGNTDIGHHTNLRKYKGETA